MGIWRAIHFVNRGKAHERLKQWIIDPLCILSLNMKQCPATCTQSNRFIIQGGELFQSRSVENDLENLETPDVRKLPFLNKSIRAWNDLAESLTMTCWNIIEEYNMENCVNMLILKCVISSNIHVFDLECNVGNIVQCNAL